jgi:hypothetical protein
LFFNRGEKMGANPWSYFVPFQPDVTAAMESLRQSVFATGRYRIAGSRPRTAVGSIQEALDLAGTSGTESILDITNGIAPEPTPGSFWHVPRAELEELYGTSTPTREAIGDADALFDRLDRGEAAYVVIYADGQPRELLFIGYSFD